MLAFSRISSSIVPLLTFCHHNKMGELILERDAPDSTLPVSIVPKGSGRNLFNSPRIKLRAHSPTKKHEGSSIHESLSNVGGCTAQRDLIVYK